MKLKDNILFLRKKNNLTQKELGKLLGVGKTTISNYETGYSAPDIPTIIKMAECFDVSIETLLGWEPQIRFVEELPELKKFDPSELVPGSFPVPVEEVPVPILGTAPCGPSSAAIQEILGRIYIDKVTAFQGDHFALYVKGDSMVPTINPGDIVLVRKQPIVDNGQVAVVLIDQEESCIKRVFFNNGGCVLQSDNQNYQPRIIEQEELLILGRVMEVRKKI